MNFRYCNKMIFKGCTSKIDWRNYVNFLFPLRVRLRSGKLELVSARKDGLFDAGDMPEHSAGV